MASIEHYIANERRAAKAQKRGGGVKITGLDFEQGEKRYSLEPAHEVTPDRIYLQKWAMTMVETVMARLGEEYHARGREELFAKLRGLLDGQGDERYAKVAAELGMSESAVKVAVHRMRKRLRELLREEVSQTVTEEAEVDAELRELMEAL
jgi:RNA polymerase sigma-70 factor (ECF subfamily)